jgi:uncharacterized protein (TIGR02270 family)
MSLTIRLASEHLDELSFLLADRTVSLDSPALGLEDLAETEERIEAHLDGLRFAGQAAVDLLQESLNDSDNDVVLASMFALASIPELDGGLDAALAAFTKAKDESIPACAAVLKHALHPEFGRRLAKLLGHERGPIRQAVLKILTYRREMDARAVMPLLKDPDPQMRGAAISALTSVGEQRDLAALEQAVLSAPGARNAEELLALLRLGSARALESCRAAIGAPDGEATAALFLPLALAGGAGDLKFIKASLGRPELKAPAAEALGLHGHPDSVPLLLQLLEDTEESVRIAAARSLDMLTGAGLKETFEIPEEEAEPIEESASEAGAGEKSEAAPTATVRVTRVSTNAAAWRDWWKGNQPTFPPGLRTREGRPFSLGQCIADLETPGRPLALRQRTLWELEIRSGQRFPFEPDAFVARQRKGLAAWQAWWKASGANFPAGAWPFAGSAAS